jgi:HEPN domain-containing protein
MQSDKKNVEKKVLRWVEYAEEDLRMAEVASSLTSNIPYRIITFHSQQCAEKYLKAFLVFHSIDFPHTHNISTLIELCSPIIDLNNELKMAKELSKYAVAARYPYAYIKISKSEALRTIRAAIKVKIIITDLLRKEGMNL